MKFIYCPICGRELIEKDSWDEGSVPYCEVDDIMYFDTPKPCVVVAVMKDKEILLLKQSYIFKNSKVLVSGYVTNGESVEETVYREVKEETGIDIEIGNLTAVSSNIGIGVQYDGMSPIPTIVTFGFTGKAVSDELTPSEESLEVNWVNRNQVLDLIDEDFTRDRTRHMLNYNGKVTYFVFSRNPYIIHGVQHLQ